MQVHITSCINYWTFTMLDSRFITTLSLELLTCRMLHAASTACMSFSVWSMHWTTAWLCNSAIYCFLPSVCMDSRFITIPFPLNCWFSQCCTSFSLDYYMTVTEPFAVSGHLPLHWTRRSFVSRFKANWNLQYTNLCPTHGAVFVSHVTDMDFCRNWSKKF